MVRKFFGQKATPQPRPTMSRPAQASATMHAHTDEELAHAEAILSGQADAVGRNGKDVVHVRAAAPSALQHMELLPLGQEQVNFGTAPAHQAKPDWTSPSRVTDRPKLKHFNHD